MKEGFRRASFAEIANIECMIFERDREVRIRKIDPTRVPDHPNTQVRSIDGRIVLPPIANALTVNEVGTRYFYLLPAQRIYLDPLPVTSETRVPA